MRVRYIIQTAANKPHKMCPNSGTWKTQKEKKFTLRRGFTTD
jgi:hypothetical protein